MKALYLDGRRGLEVMLDGPALRVRSADHADARYPLARVARIVTCGAVRWNPHALITCLRFGKPIAILDNLGRFLRLCFSVPQPELGLARHIGELLGVERYRCRYETWFHATEKREMLAVARQFGIGPLPLRKERLWHVIRSSQARWQPKLLSKAYRYLNGLATAHVASLLVRIGLPNDPTLWDKEEWRFLNDIVSLGTWRHATLLDQLLAQGNDLADRRILTCAFEAISEEREGRITAWRRESLLAMMGLWHGDADIIACLPPGLKNKSVSELPEGQVRPHHIAHGHLIGNAARIPLASKNSLRTNIKILRTYLEYDRRVHELV